MQQSFAAQLKKTSKRPPYLSLVTLKKKVWDPIPCALSLKLTVLGITHTSLWQNSDNDLKIACVNKHEFGKFLVYHTRYNKRFQRATSPRQLTHLHETYVGKHAITFYFIFTFLCRYIFFFGNCSLYFVKPCHIHPLRVHLRNKLTAPIVTCLLFFSRCFATRTFRGVASRTLAARYVNAWHSTRARAVSISDASMRGVQSRSTSTMTLFDT